MKKFKQALLPVVIVLMGIGAAFASNAAKSSGSSEPGYYFDSSQSRCISPNVQCSSTPGDLCTWTDPTTFTTYELHSRINDTMCDDNTLYKQQ